MTEFRCLSCEKGCIFSDEMFRREEHIVYCPEIGAFINIELEEE